MVTSLSCTIPIASLISSPFNLTYGSSVYARVTAKNYYGSSITSMEANGAIIVGVPDSPLSLADNTAVTSATVIGLTW